MSDPPTAKKKYQGTVKWFSNRKGYGFITPGKDDDGCPVTDDIFVHQSTIHSEGYRTLSEGWVVEFAVGHDDDGKAKAEDVTAPGGGYVTGPRRPPHPRSRRRRSPRKDRDDDDDDDGAAPQEGNEGKEGEEKASAGGGGGGRRGGGGRHRGPRTSSSGGGAPPPPPHWHDSLSSDVKSKLQSKGVRTSTGTLDVSLGTSRIKLGTRGYASVADSRAVLAEGSFECDGEGKATFTWKRSIAFAGGEWKTMDDGERGKVLPGSLTLGDDAVGAVGTDETASTLWGESVTDPRPALESNGFEMRRVVLTTKRR